jgi:hypothetical protein
MTLAARRAHLPAPAAAAALVAAGDLRGSS